jgi:hypothetical protein
MAMVEIIGGDGVEFTFQEFKIKAQKVYETDAQLYQDRPHYEVYEIDKSNLKLLETISWADDFGWYRYAKGSNMGTPYSFFTVNGSDLIAWDGAERDKVREWWNDEPIEEKEAYHYSFKEYENNVKPREYSCLTEYMREELGASTESNVCALSVDLAKANGMTMAKLFDIYEG